MPRKSTEFQASDAGVTMQSMNWALFTGALGGP